VEKFDKLGISGKSGDPHPSLLDSKLDKFSKGETGGGNNVPIHI